MKAGVFAEPVLVGREQELAELEHHLKLATEGKGTTVFISGEAGAGKTRLVNEFLNIAKKEEITTLFGWCLSNAAIPYFPFIEAFNAHFKGEKENGAKETENEESEVEAWLIGLKQREKTGKPVDLSAQTMKDLTLAAVTKALLSFSAKKSIILFIDDLHWADSASLALLHYIARAITTQRVIVLATFRSEELMPDDEGHPHPLVETLRLMGREDLFKEIRLPYLDQTCVSEIAENMIGESLAPEFAAKLAEESQGNPLFIVESLRMLSEQGALVQEKGLWHLSIDELGIPTKIKDIILRRVGALKPKHRRVLDLASVIGEKFDVELLGDVLGQDSLEVLETLNWVAQSSCLIVCEGDSFRFDHDRSREALYEEISPPLKRGYHARIAEKIEKSSRKAKDSLLGDLAYHYSQAGNKEKSVEYSLAAGQDSLARYSNTEAIKHFKYVLEAVANIDGYSKERKAALEGLGDAYYANCKFEKAAKTFERLASLETGALKARAYRKEMGAVWFVEYDTSRLMELVRKAEEHVSPDRLESARVLWYRAAALLRLGDMKASLRDHEEALRIFKEEYSLPDVAQLLSVTGITRLLFGRDLKKGLGEQQRAIALYQELGDARGEITATLHRDSAFRFLGLIQELEGSYTNLLEIGEKIGDFETLAQATMQMTYGPEFLGRFEEAIALGLKALEYSQKTDTRRLHSQIYAGLAWRYARIGDLKQANQYYGKLMKMPPEILCARRNAFAVLLVEAVMFAAKNQWKEANQRFEKLFEMSKTENWTPIGLEIFAIIHYVWALDLQGRTEEAKIQREEFQKRPKEAGVRFAHADLQADLMMLRKFVVGEEVEMRLDMVNVGRGSGTIIKVEGLIPLDGFKVTALPSYCSLKNGDLEVGAREIGAFQVETIKLNVQALKTGVFSLSPLVVYIDDLGEARTCKSDPVVISVQEVQPTFEVLPGRISTGFAELDALLLGGIPKNYAVTLTSTSIDERELIAQKFLEAGAKSGETTFYVTVEPRNAKILAEEYPSNFFLFVCNPQADATIQNMPSVYKLEGVENLTEINISLTKALRKIEPSATGPKRICIEILSDVLLQHHAVATRKWLSWLLPNLKSKDFTILAMLNPQMHPKEEVQAILSLFEGEINISEKETTKGIEKVLRIRRLYNQKYSDDELFLTREKLK